MITVGIVGGSGYVGGELIRCLLQHPEVSIAFAHSKANTGTLVADVHRDLYGSTELTFTDTVQETNVLFLCSGHGQSRKFLEKNEVSDNTSIIDLSQDFRLTDHSTFGERRFVYGLPEKNVDQIKLAQHIANPGCFATAIQLALLPLASNGMLEDEVHIHAITGSTGAGQAPSATTHFSWRNNNLSVYKAFEHQHLNEIGETVVSCQNDFDKSLNFIPLRGDFSRGILASVYTNCSASEASIKEAYQKFYDGKPFTQVINGTVDLKQVVNTNNCYLQVEKHGDKVLIVSAIDNLIKGAAGQAIQNMNLMMGLEESTGLNFKASYF